MADEKQEETPESPDVHFEPLVDLPMIDRPKLEENEEELVKLRARLYRYDKVAEPAEWKERGTGDVKILRHKERNTCRILMRRDKTLKICCNHFILPSFDLQPKSGSDKVWVWSTPADFSDEELKSELLAIRFGTVENAQKFYDKFEEARKMMEEQETTRKGKSEQSPEAEKSEADEAAEKLGTLSVKDDKQEEDKQEDNPDTSNSSEKEAER